MTTPSPKVLLVDDRRDNLIALEAVLQGLPVEPVAVDSGEEALKKLLTDDFAVILLDAQMPGMDGFETANHIKRRERTRLVPIIFLTAADRDMRLALRGYAAGAVDYLSKPVDPWVVRAKVSVFVELWTKNRQLLEQAEARSRSEVELRSLRAAMDEARNLLRQAAEGGVDGALAVARAVEVLERPATSRPAPRSQTPPAGP